MPNNNCAIIVFSFFGGQTIHQGQDVSDRFKQQIFLVQLPTKVDDLLNGLLNQNEVKLHLKMVQATKQNTSDDASPNK